MKNSIFATIIVVFMLPLIALPILFASSSLEAYGRIHIPARGVSREVYHQPDESCRCCDPLFGGGEVYVDGDFSAVEVGDVAHLISLEGDHKVLECFEIVDFIRVGRWFFNRSGAIHANGDVLVFSDGVVYRFIIL